MCQILGLPVFAMDRAFNNVSTVVKDEDNRF